MKKIILLVTSLLFLIIGSGMALAEVRVACVGDSITAGWKLKEAEKYVTKLAGLLGSDYEVENFGHSAYAMLKVADKSYWDSPMFAAAQEFKPDIVTIMLGTNDAHPNYWPQHEALYYQDYLDMIAVFEALPSAPRVIVLGLPYLKPGSRYDGVVAINVLLPNIATDAGVEFVEIWDALLDSGLSTQQLMKDPIHPSASAHSIIAETVYPVIANAVCGDLACEPGEDACGCFADCGPPPTEESLCGDLKDNDCDGITDCEDPDCSEQQDCQSACDGDGICEAGENCENCGSDCARQRTGRPNRRYCCGNDIVEGPEGGGICDGNP